MRTFELSNENICSLLSVFSVVHVGGGGAVMQNAKSSYPNRKDQGLFKDGGMDDH